MRRKLKCDGKVERVLHDWRTRNPSTNKASVLVSGVAS